MAFGPNLLFHLSWCFSSTAQTEQYVFVLRDSTLSLFTFIMLLINCFIVLGVALVNPVFTWRNDNHFKIPSVAFVLLSVGLVFEVPVLNSFASRTRSVRFVLCFGSPYSFRLRLETAYYTVLLDGRNFCISDNRKSSGNLYVFQN